MLREARLAKEASRMVDLVLQYTYSPLEHPMTICTAASTSPATAPARATRLRLLAANRRRGTELQRRLSIARTLRAV